MNRTAFNLGILFFMIMALPYKPASAQEFSFEATQTVGVGKAEITISIVDPTETTGDSYRVTFTIDELGAYFYSVENLSTQITLVDALSVDETSPLFEGVQVAVNIPGFQIDEIIEVQYDGTPVEPPVHVFRPGDRQGRGGPNSTGDYTFVGGGGDGSFGRVTFREANTLGNDYELRFDGNPETRNYLTYAIQKDGTIPVPFSLWNIGRGTPDDSSDDRQILALGVELGADATVYDGDESPSDGGPGDMYDWIYFYEIDTTVTAEADINSDNVVNYDDFLLDLLNNGGDLSSNIRQRPYTGAEVIRRRSLVNLTSDPSFVPPSGTVIRINTTKKPTEQDVFEFTTPNFGLYTNALSLNFGSVAINSQFILSLPVINDSNNLINVSSIGLDPEHFSVAKSNFTISPGDTELVDISFEPKELGLQTVAMTLNSNDVTFPQYVLTLAGEGLPPFEPGKIKLLSRLDIKAGGVVTDVWGYYDAVSQREFALIGYGSFPPNSGIQIIDVTNPSRPVEVADLNTVPGFDVKTWQNYAYTVTGGGGSGSVIDLTNPDDPQVVGSFPSAHNITIAENGYMYAANPGGIKIYDLNPDPTNPAFVGQVGTSGHDATIVGDILYDFHGRAGTFFYDVSDPTSPNLLGEIQTPEIAYHHSGWPTKDGRYVYICDELPHFEGLLTDITIWDISDFTNPVLVNSISDPTATVHNLFIVGDYVYVSYYSAGFKVFDASDPVNPELIYQYDTEPIVEGVGFDGAWGVYPLAPSGNIYVSDRTHGLFIFDSPNVANSVINDKISPEALFIFFSLVDNTFQFELNLTNTSSDTIFLPTVSIGVLTPAPPAVEVDNADNGVRGLGAVYNYSTSLGGDGKWAPGETTDNKLWRFKLSGAFNFMFTANVYGVIQDNGGTAISKGTAGYNEPFVFVVDAKKGTVEIYRNLTAVPMPEPLPQEFALQQNYPNPFNPETTIRFKLPQAENVTINIFNLHGQLVRKLVGENREAGFHEIVWDARDNEGNSLSSGVYLYRIQAGEFSDVKKLMLLR